MTTEKHLDNRRPDMSAETIHHAKLHSEEVAENTEEPDSPTSPPAPPPSPETTV